MLINNVDGFGGSNAMLETETNVSIEDRLINTVVDKALSTRADVAVTDGGRRTP
jgi:hypothetical protein